VPKKIICWVRLKFSKIYGNQFVKYQIVGYPEIRLARCYLSWFYYFSLIFLNLLFYFRFCINFLHTTFKFWFVIGIWYFNLFKGFIKYLKRRDIIKSYFWIINYKAWILFPYQNLCLFVLVSIYYSSECITRLIIDWKCMNTLKTGPNPPSPILFAVSKLLVACLICLNVK
jgi:hypothetical protein